MGSFAYYEGYNNIPQKERKLFAKQMLRILDIGGMMEITWVDLFDTELYLLRPVREMSGNKIFFSYNYFEDRCWETATFTKKGCVLTSGKIGGAEFSDVLEAAYMLYEVYDPEMGFAKVDRFFANASRTLSWLNEILNTDFSLGKRTQLWSCIEASVSPERSYLLTTETLRELIPYCRWENAGGTDLTDLLYVINGTKHLSKDTVQKGTYPAIVLECKQALKRYLKTSSDDANDMKHKLEALWELLCKSYEERQDVCDEQTELAQLTLRMPARVFVYLTAELLKNEYDSDECNFWKFWEALSPKVYHDEKMAQYASKELKQWREINMGLPFRKCPTVNYLCQDNYSTFRPPVEELKGKPNYYISNADRLFWWDGTLEVTISDKTDEWLKELAKQYQEFLAEEPEVSDVKTALRDFVSLLSEIDHYYLRLYPFESMFNEFKSHLKSKEYRAAIKLIRQISEEEENRKAGKIVQNRTYSELENKNVIENEGRLQVKRLYAVLANKKLREKYFGF